MGVKVLVADDDPLVREALEIILRRDERFELAGSAANGEEALALGASCDIDVALLDIRMPRRDGLAACAALSSPASPKRCRVLLLSTFMDDDLARKALAAGASGYLLKGAGADEIKRAILLVASGHSVFHDDVLAALVSKGAPGDLSALSERERELALLIADGYSNKQAADKLGLSEGTVKNYVSSILDKLGLGQRTHIAVYCVSGKKDFT
jgi:DNA-binding NarL/FixJ family response regulator